MRELIFSEKEIQEACKKIGGELTKDLSNEARTPVVLGVMKGALNFMCDLVKKIEVPVFLDYIQVSSYAGTSSSGDIKLVKDFNFDIKNRTVIIVEDIVDTGYSMNYLINHMESYGPKRVIVVCLFDKVCARKVPVKIDYCGKQLNENKFIAGYGLDYNELERATPYVYAVDHEELMKMDNILANDRKNG